MPTQHEIDELVSSIYNIGMIDGVEALNPKQQTCYFVTELMTFISMEGILGLYSSRVGAYAAEFAMALETIGAHEGAELFRKANSLFPGGSPSADEMQRHAEAWSPDINEEVSNLGDRIVTEHELEIYQKRDEFVAKNFEEINGD